VAEHPWQADMQRLRARTREPGLANPGHAAMLGGLALLQAMVDGRVPDPPITRTLDFYLLEVERGRAVFQGEPAFAHYNPIGTVHGGWHATLLDSAMACAVHTLVEPGFGYTTLEFKIHCVRPLTDRTGPVRAIGLIVAAGRRAATAEGRLVDAEGRVYSHGTTTCLFIEAAAERGA
jgi:uncharacterized protein (TIGR00369 family)